MIALAWIPLIGNGGGGLYRDSERRGSLSLRQAGRQGGKRLGTVVLISNRSGSLQRGGECCGTPGIRHMGIEAPCALARVPFSVMTVTNCSATGSRSAGSRDARTERARRPRRRMEQRSTCPGNDEMLQRLAACRIWRNFTVDVLTRYGLR